MRSLCVTWPRCIPLFPMERWLNSPGRASTSRIHQQARLGQKAREGRTVSSTAGDGRPGFVHRHGHPPTTKGDGQMKRATLMVAALALLYCGVGQAKAGIVSSSQLTLVADANGDYPQSVGDHQVVQDNAIGTSLATASHDGVGAASGTASASVSATALQYGSGGSVVFNNDLLGIKPGGFGWTIGYPGPVQTAASASGQLSLTFTDTQAGTFLFHYAVSSGGFVDNFYSGSLSVQQQGIGGLGTTPLKGAGDIAVPFAANLPVTVTMTSPQPNVETGVGAIFPGQSISETAAAVYNFGINSLPGSSPFNPVMPMAQNSNGGYVFLPPTFHNSPTYIDPPIATGYDYNVTGQNFSSVVVPGPLADGQTTFLLKFNGYTETLQAGTPFNFDNFVTGGVSDFTITGIDAANGLDPNNPGAIVTGLTYEGQGLQL